MKIKAWGVRQSVLGGTETTIFFDTKEERDKYCMQNDFCDKVRCREVDTMNVIVYDTIENERRIHSGQYDLEEIGETMQSRLKDYFIRG